MERALGTTGTDNRKSKSIAQRGERSSLLWAPLLAIGTAAFCVEIPFFFLGTPSGHDVEFHLYSWLEVLGQWKHGTLFPRWASLAHFAYGEPRFVFYPPASWTLGGLISAIFPWTIASPVFIWIALVLAGVSMFFAARRWLDRRDAVFAAVLYAVNPYHLVIVYWRSSFAELLASCLVPLLFLLLVEGAEERGWRVTVPLGFVLAAAWLTNAPAAVMIHYSLALLVVSQAAQKRAARIILIATASVALGACLSAFYLVPAIYEQRWIEISNAVSAGSRPADNFLFIHTSDADHDAFNKLITWVAVLEMFTVVGAAAAARAWRETQRAAWNSLIGWAGACSVMMLSVTGILWQFLPKMRFMQFPWRWTLCLSAIFTLFVTIGVKRWWMRAVVYAACVLLIGVAWHRVQVPWWDNAGDLREMQDNMYTGAGYEGTDEYTPLGGDPGALDKDARKVTVDGPAHAAIRVLQWNAESKVFSAEMSAADRLALRLFEYPAWRVEVNGRVVSTTAREGTGQMLVPVGPGANRVDISFVRTRDRSVGGWVSVATILALIGWWVRKFSF
ncbi:MAG TPA: 6-pyruvoyl-tetrahydropterin synthase-related protein [Candidatus Solibacter sp.]|nr:6-pyruvoyl-tetrahydropterin synthase-related protein [Candidatus Solibacter sp.]